MSEQDKSTLLTSLADSVIKAIEREFMKFEKEHVVNSELKFMSTDLIATVAIASSVYICNYVNQLHKLDENEENDE